MNKKKIMLLVAVIFLLLVSIFVIFLVNSNKMIICELNKNNYNTVVYINKEQFINFDYKYSFDNIEKSVDKFDMMSSYIDFISKFEGVEASINQNKNNLEYSIKIEIENVSKDNYKLLEIEKVVDLNNKDIIKYYEDLGYTCK